MLSPDALQHARRRYVAAWRSLRDTGPANFSSVLRELLHPTVAWHGPQPLNHLNGVDAFIGSFWTPFTRAFRDVERRDDIVLGGEFKAGSWLASTGHYVATFSEAWLGIAPTHEAVTLRYGEFCRVEADKIVEVYVIIDVLDLMRQAGCWPRILPPPLGSPDRIPGPASADGVILAPQSADAGLRSLKLVEAMIAGLMEYDQRSLDSMRMERFWDVKSMMWYGPAGIGTARGMSGFQRCHQAPFLKAFPDRVGGNHKARLGEGNYVASTGWPSMRATHSGDGWLGRPATNKPITQRIMDFWRRENDLLLENWVFIDTVDLLMQMGVNVLPAAH